jgi:hypothetical protein
LLWQKRKRAKARRRLQPAPTPTPTAAPVLSLELSPAALPAAEGRAEGVPLKEAATPMLPMLPAAAEDTVGEGEADGELLPDGVQLPDGLAAALLPALLLAAGDTEGEAARAARAAGHSLSPSTALCAAEPLATITRAQKPVHLSM